MHIVFGLALSISLLVASSVSARDWRIASFNGSPARGDTLFLFETDGSFRGNSGCNGFQGTGRMEAGAWVVEGPVAMTKKACSETAVATQDNTIVALLNGPVGLAYDPTADTLALAANGVSVTLASPAKGRDADAAPTSETVADVRYLDVYGVSGKLNIRAEPSTGAAIIAKVLAGTLLINEGCEGAGVQAWCKVRLLEAGGKTGWAAAEFLEPATAALRAGQGAFEQIGRLPCGAEGAALEPCEFGIARDPGGSAVVTVFKPDGSERVLFFIDGAFAYADASEAGGGFDAEGRQEDGVFLIQVDAERYEVDASYIGSQ